MHVFVFVLSCFRSCDSSGHGLTHPALLPRSGTAPSAPASPVALSEAMPRSGRFAALLLASLAVSIRAPADATASANVDRPQLSKIGELTFERF